MHAQEIKNNISLIRVAINDIERNDFNEQLKRFYKELDTSGKQSYLSSTEESVFGMKCLSVDGQLNAKECLAIKQQLIAIIRIHFTSLFSLVKLDLL